MKYTLPNGSTTNDVIEWAKALENDEGRKVGSTQIGDYYVSTVYIGISSCIYETMVFDKNGDEVDCERYDTESGAKAGHFQMVKKWER